MKSIPVAFRFAILALVYFIGGWISYEFATGYPDLPLFWAPAGIGILAILLGGFSYLPALVVGSFGIYLLSPLPTSVWFFLTASQLATTSIIVWLFQQMGLRADLARVRDVSAIILGSVLFALVNASLGSWIRIASQVPPQGDYVGIWIDAWLSDFMGLLIITPLGLACWYRPPCPPHRWREAVILFTVVFAIAALIDVSRPYVDARNPLPSFLFLPCFAFAAIRLGLLGTTMLSFLLMSLFLLESRFLSDPRLAISSHDLLMDRIEMLAMAASTALVIAGFGTERTCALTDARTSEAKLLAVLTASSDGIWEYEFASDQVQWSEQIYQLLGYPHELRIDRMMSYGIIHPDDLATAIQSIEARLKHEKIFAVEMRIRRFDGNFGHYRISGKVIGDQDRSRRIVGSIHDITDRIAFEEQRLTFERQLMESQRLESLSVLAGGIAHDFNNLLTAILGHASLTRMDLPDNSPLQNHLQAVEEASLKAAELCQQMLAFAGKARHSAKPIDLSRLIQDSGRLIQLTVSKSTHVHYELNRTLPPILGDVTQLRQMLMALVINASEAIGNRSGTISIRTDSIDLSRRELDAMILGPTVREGRFVRLEVIDTGCGMNEDVIGKLFDPFFSTKFVGRGLGLAAVLGLVQKHQGCLTVSSQVGVGSNFRIYLPSTLFGTTTSQGDVIADSVILFGSDAKTLHRTQAILQSFGLQVVATDRIEEAVSLARQQADDRFLILWDAETFLGNPLSIIEQFGELRQQLIVIRTNSEIDLFRDIAEIRLINKPLRKEEIRGMIQSIIRPDNVSPLWVI